MDWRQLNGKMCPALKLARQELPMTFDEMLHEAYGAVESNYRDAREAVRAYITDLLEQQREACAKIAGGDQHCSGCNEDHIGDDVATQVRSTQLVEIK